MAELRLTPRQLEICRRIARGETNKEIAHSLGVSEQTAKWHVSRLLEQFDVTNRAALAARVSKALDDDSSAT